MRLTLTWLCLCLAIYCGGGFGHNGQGNVVLSLPPSLIAATEAAALRQLQQQQQRQQQQQKLHELQQSRWKKDARVLFDSGNDAQRDMVHSKESASATGKYNLPYNEDDGSEVEQQPQPQPQSQPADFNRNALSKAYDLEARQQSAPQEIAQRRGHGLGGVKFATPKPHKYGTSRCQATNGNCLREYNRAMLAARNREALSRLQQQLYNMQDHRDPYSGEEAIEDDADTMEGNESKEEMHLKNTNNEVFMLLTGEQDLVKFLRWAMQLLYPHQHTEINGNAYYHPGMFIWKKLNFSGNLEPPLIVDEPHYVLVRREKQNAQLGDDFKPEDDPFIPPRGRKHNAPDLDALLNRFETFVPNRGKRDNVKDLFKYDDLFFPNRGKKHRDIFKLDDPFFPHRGKKLQLRDLYNVDDPFFPNRGKRHLTEPMPMASKWGKLQSDSSSNSNSNKDYENGSSSSNKGDNWPQRMSTHEINSNDQSVKPSMSARAKAVAEAEDARWRLLQLTANRLHSTTRSMSANLQPKQRQQVKTSWPAESLQRLERSVHHDTRETQLTRGLNASPGHGHNHDHATDIDNDIDTDYGQLDM